MFGINGVDLGEIAHGGQKHADAHDVAKAFSGGFQNGREIHEELHGFCFDTAFDERAGRRILRHLAAEEDVPAAANGLRKRTDRRRELGRNDSDFRHDEFLVRLSHSQCERVSRAARLRRSMRVRKKLGVGLTSIKFIILTIIVRNRNYGIRVASGANWECR